VLIIIGKYLTHIKFGEGKVKKTEGDFIYIYFPLYGELKFYAKAMFGQVIMDDDLEKWIYKLSEYDEMLN